MKASEKQILALSKVFAPHYTRWKTWATANLDMRDASRMIDKVRGMTQNDLGRKPHVKEAFDEVRDMARQIGYEYSIINNA